RLLRRNNALRAGCLLTCSKAFSHSRLDFHSPLGKRPAVFPMSAFAISSSPFARLRLTPPVAALAALAILFAAAVIAQVEGDRGIAPVASSADIEVFDISVNATGDNAEDA